MKTIDVLIIGSGDMNGQADGYNFPKSVIGIPFPCKSFEKSKDKQCNKCKYTRVEHKYGYPLFPLHPVKTLWGQDQNKKNLYSKSGYSELWKNKYVILERLIRVYGKDIDINYTTLTPDYKTDVAYLPTINKINSILEKKLKLKGTFKNEEPYHYKCMLEDIYKQKKYNGKKYDCILVVGAGPGWLYTSRNFKIMRNLLKEFNEEQTPRFIGNVWEINHEIKKHDFSGQMEFMNPIDQCTGEFARTSVMEPNAIKHCIRDYAKILLENKEFIQRWDMLFKIKI